MSTNVTNCVHILKVKSESKFVLTNIYTASTVGKTGKMKDSFKMAGYFSFWRDVNKLTSRIGDHIGSLMHCRVEGNRLREIMKLPVGCFICFI